MDREFMSHYYDVTYEDIELDATEGDEEYRNRYNEYLVLKEQLTARCGGQDSDLWSLCEKLIDQQNLLMLRLCKLVYLLGAEDREKMLR
ncbi:MAG: hypothetical protein LUC87_00720 [Clostridiales bacterium]|nr:hypothetical protein [Clostridiales bacterium]